MPIIGSITLDMSRRESKIIVILPSPHFFNVSVALITIVWWVLSQSMLILTLSDLLDPIGEGVRDTYGGSHSEHTYILLFIGNRYNFDQILIVMLLTHK